MMQKISFKTGFQVNIIYTDLTVARIAKASFHIVP